MKIVHILNCLIGFLKLGNWSKRVFKLLLFLYYMKKSFIERKDWKGKEQRKPTRTISGVAPISVMVPPRRCPHGVCAYCPTFENAYNHILQKALQ
jgi:hypothetical protein